MAGINLQLDPEALEPLIRLVVEQTLRTVQEAEARLGNGRLAYNEAEAAELLGLEEHQLRDERLRGRIKASAIVGRRIRYRREDLVQYLAGRPWEKKA